MEISLFEPRIPQNTGSIARTCAAFNTTLNLIEPLGFRLDDKYLKRAGLDYWHLMKINRYSNFEVFKKSKKMNRILAFSKKMEFFSVILNLKRMIFYYLEEKIMDFQIKS